VHIQDKAVIDYNSTNKNVHVKKKFWKDIMTPTLLQVFNIYVEASKNYKLIIIQFDDYFCA